MSQQSWPRDAVMIVAANWGEQLEQHMDAVVEVACRECRRELAADSHVIAEAARMRERYGRPIRFFCVQCAVSRQNNVDILVDHRRRTPDDRV